ncbi:hypothetical protein PIROE2DRAFT_61569 [Piromyces sp. E2]|nr:hypothetical protein PIROE2DRAFT_61569 [Piromyces sp. E2]|eukprot:OUM62943.1 hypothetical protein PIROE2DRAFT_61569 [Piromyces sp. E2]
MHSKTCVVPNVAKISQTLPRNHSTNSNLSRRSNTIHNTTPSKKPVPFFSKNIITRRNTVDPTSGYFESQKRFEPTKSCSVHEIHYNITNTKERNDDENSLQLPLDISHTISGGVVEDDDDIEEDSNQQSNELADNLNELDIKLSESPKEEKKKSNRVSNQYIFSSDSENTIDDEDFYSDFSSIDYNEIGIESADTKQNENVENNKDDKKNNNKDDKKNDNKDEDKKNDNKNDDNSVDHHHLTPPIYPNDNKPTEKNSTLNNNDKTDQEVQHNISFEENNQAIYSYGKINNELDGQTEPTIQINHSYSQKSNQSHNSNQSQVNNGYGNFNQNNKNNSGMYSPTISYSDPVISSVDRINSRNSNHSNHSGYSSNSLNQEPFIGPPMPRPSSLWFQ